MEYAIEETLGDTYQYRYIKQSRRKHVKLFGQKYTPFERTRLCTDYQKNSSLSFSILSFFSYYRSDFPVCVFGAWLYQSIFFDHGLVSYLSPPFSSLSNLSSFLGGLAGSLDSYFAGKYIYQNQAESYTEITVTGEDAQHSDLPTNDEVVALIKQHIESQENQGRQGPNRTN